MTTKHSDPFDLDDHRPRRATELDRWIADGVREVERTKEATVDDEDCPECNGTGECWDCDGSGESEDNHEDDGSCSACYGIGICSGCDGDGVSLKPSRLAEPDVSALSRAWEAASGEGQVVS